MLACSFPFSYRDMVLGFMMKVDDLMFVRAIVSTVRGRRSGLRRLLFYTSYLAPCLLSFSGLLTLKLSMRPNFLCF